MLEESIGRRVWPAAVVLAAALGTGCRITDQAVRDEIETRGGTIVSQPNQFQLEGERTFTVGNPNRVQWPQPQIGISVAAGVNGPCLDCCWETVAREYFDGKPVLDPGSLEDDPDQAAALTARAVNGFHPDVRVGQNPPGRGVDGTCDASKRGRQDYFDAPNFPDREFDSNPVNSSARVYVLEQETCMRCLNPASGYLGCLKWYYVKVRRSDVSPPIIKLVTTGVVAAGPTQEFRDAMDAWNRP